MTVSGLDAFYDEHGNCFSSSLYYVHEIDEELVSLADLEHDLKRTDLVLADLRGSTRATAVAAAVLEKTDNTVACLSGGSPEMMALVRMGSFSFREMLEHRKTRTEEPSIQRIQKIMRWIERAGDVLPAGKLKHIRNWNKASRYWSHGGKNNVKNMLVFLGREYLGLDLRLLEYIILRLRIIEKNLIRTSLLLASSFTVACILRHRFPGRTRLPRVCARPAISCRSIPMA